MLIVFVRSGGYTFAKLLNFDYRTSLQSTLMSATSEDAYLLLLERQTALFQEMVAMEREFNKKKMEKVAVLLQLAEQIGEADAAREHAATTSPASAVVAKKQMKKKSAQAGPRK
jgi:hypothetical protein